MYIRTKANVNWLRNILGKTAREGSTPEAQSAAPPIAQIIIHAHGSIENLRACLSSTLESFPGRDLIIVLDSRDEDTADYLARFTADHACILVQNLDILGFRRSVAKAAGIATADYLAVLDCDAVVTAGCLRELVEELKADSKADVAVGLLDTQLAQCLQEAGEPDEAVASFLSNSNAELVAAAIESSGMPEVVAFDIGSFTGHPCFAIRRSEVSRFLNRGATSGPARLCVAPRCYGNFRNPVVDEIHRPALEAVDSHVTAEVVTALGAVASSASWTDEILGQRVLFLLPSPGGNGGAHSVVQEVVGLRKCGLDAGITNRAANRRSFERCYPEAVDFCTFYSNEEELLDLAAGAAIISATNYASVTSLKSIVDRHPAIVPMYYVQDYEPWFYPAQTPQHTAAEASYSLVPNARAFAKTDWLCRIVNEMTGIDVARIQPSLDRSLYNGLTAEPDGTPPPGCPVAITAMIRPSSARRNPVGTLSVLQQIQNKHGKSVDIRVFGCVDEELDELEEAQNFRFVNLGELRRWEVAEVLRGADIFADLSTFQAFGCTGLEAMAVGCATVLPVGTGVEEYASNNENCLLVDTTDSQETVAAIDRLIRDEPLRRRIREAALATGRRYSVRKAAWSQLCLFGDSLRLNRESFSEESIANAD